MPFSPVMRTVLVTANEAAIRVVAPFGALGSGFVRSGLHEGSAHQR